MDSIFNPVLINPVDIEPFFINENWPRFNIISDGNFTVFSPLVPCILSGVNVRPTTVLKLFCDLPILTWEHVNKIPSRLLTNITKGPQYAVTRNLKKDRGSLSLIRKSAAALLSLFQTKESKVGVLLIHPPVLASSNSSEGFIELMQRGPHERETRFLQFTLQRLGDLIYIPHLLAHAVLTLDTGLPTILSGWDAVTTTNQQIIKL